MQRSIYANPQPRRTISLHVTMTEDDAELLDRLRQRMAVGGMPLPHNDVIAKALHLLDSVQQRAQMEAGYRSHPDLIVEAV